MRILANENIPYDAILVRCETRAMMFYGFAQKPRDAMMQMCSRGPLLKREYWSRFIRISQSLLFVPACLHNAA